MSFEVYASVTVGLQLDEQLSNISSTVYARMVDASELMEQYKLSKCMGN